MTIGVLAVQGGFAEHRQALARLGADSCEIRQPGDLRGFRLDGLILPGGESTVIGKLLHDTGLFEPLGQLIAAGTPVFGTCAGLLLLAKHIANDERVYFRAIDITAQRNAFGRQLGSFQAEGDFAGLGALPMTFIRAPYIAAAGAGVRVLAQVNGLIVAAEQRNVLVAAFHPELTPDLRVHRYFLARCAPR